ncbi:DUF6525 family protein [Pseudoroseicyclus tamaricis]|uniref:DUF6525 family protein n=1 Tax=Pseudoroseicyclus tamaricis TaxID=2705421 RepID=UPI003742C699
MIGNLGRTSLKRRRREGEPMREFERLPPALRLWVARAILPWRPVSAHRAYRQALASTGSHGAALTELDDLERRLVPRGAIRVWGAAYPAPMVAREWAAERRAAPPLGTRSLRIGSPQRSTAPLCPRDRLPFGLSRYGSGRGPIRREPRRSACYNVT